MANPYSNLIETTRSGYEQRTYTLGLGVSPTDLTEEELIVVTQSIEYEKRWEREMKARTLEMAYQDFERLRDLPNMPDEAIEILKRWTTRDGDDDEEI